MGKYYNTQRGPLAVSLSSGKAITVPPKSWVDIDPSDEGSPSLAPMIRKGYLKRSTLPDPAPAPAAVEAVAAPAPAPAPAPPSLPPSDKKDSAAPATKSVTAAGEIKK